MRLFILLFSVLLMLTACSSPSSKNFEHGTFDTPKGIKYSHLKTPGHSKVAIIITWNNNYVFQDNVNPSVAQLGVQLMPDAGAGNLDGPAIIEKFNDLQATGQLLAVDNKVVGKVFFEKNDFDEILALTEDIILKPKFDNKWFERIKSNFLKNQQELYTKDEFLSGDAVMRYIFNHQKIYQLLAQNNFDQISSLTIEDVKEWYKATFTRDNVQVVIAGNITKEKAELFVDRILGSLPSSNHYKKPTLETNFTPKTILLHLPKASKSILSMIAPMKRVSSENTYQSIYSITKLGQNDDNLLMQALRDDLRSTYAFGAGIIAYTHDLFGFFMSGQVETEKLSAAKTKALETYESFLNQTEFSDLIPFKKVATKNYEKEREHTLALAETYNYLLSYQENTDYINNHKQFIDELNSTKVREFIQQYFPRSDQFIIIATSPDRNALPNACVITSVLEIDKCR